MPSNPLSKWSIIYEKAIKDNGELFFPDRLTKEFLDEAKQKMGSFLFANQYLNEIFPADDAKFKKEWFRYTNLIPDNHLNFVMIDPAISTEDGADYTGLVVVSTDENMNWYLRIARRERLNPTQIVDLCFRLNQEFRPRFIGIESVAYQKALLYMIHQEAQRRGAFLPMKEMKPDNTMSKEMRIMGLIPRFEWGRIYLSNGLEDFERELLQFPRASHDDIIDALAYCENLVYYPPKQNKNQEPLPGSPEHERQLIEHYARQQNESYY